MGISFRNILNKTKSTTSFTSILSGSRRHEYNQVVNNYIFDIPSSDFIAVALKRTAVFTQDTIPPYPIIRNHDSPDPYMHIKLRDLLYVLHKLNVRPTP